MNVDNLQWIRDGLRQPGKTQTGLAQALDRNPSAITDLLKGKRALKLDEVPRVAAYLGVPAPNLFGQDETTMVPLIAWVSAGQMTETAVVTEPEKWLPIAGLGRGDYFATAVRGSSMDRLSPEGSIIVVDRSDTRLQHNKPFLFAIRGEATYKLWNERIQALMPYSTVPHDPIPVDPTGFGFDVIGRVRRTMMDL